MHEKINQAFALAGRNAVVTGAASGIGREAAITLARAGARLWVVDVDAAGLNESVRQISAEGGEVVAATLDVRNRQEVDALAARVAGHGRLDIWANVAGVASFSPVVDTDEADLDRLIAINLKGCFWGCAAAARIMTAQRCGSIINISSSGADANDVGLSAYAMTKAAVNMLTRTLAHEVGPSNVRVNAVAPGIIDTPILSYRLVDADEDSRRQISDRRRQRSVLGRIGEPSDIALCMLYLASDAAKFVTGQIIRPNGGMTMP